jgi:hypothetical protein
MMDNGVSGAFLVPFFGPLPPYFIHWVKSCEINHHHFHWFVYSDRVRSRRRLNRAVTVIPYSFEAMASDFRDILGIDICRENRRMVCNFRLLLYCLRRRREPLDRYDFIGYTDMDMVYGDLARFLPGDTRTYRMISGDDGHPCGPFTLMCRAAAAALPDSSRICGEMARRSYWAFDESPEFMAIVADGGPVFCRADPLQPAMTPGINHRKIFSVWDRGRVTVWDCRGRRVAGGFHHFSRFKGKARFRVRSDAISHPAWGICKYGIFPVNSRRAFWRLGLSLLA